jgi:hypothetical protein
MSRSALEDKFDPKMFGKLWIKVIKRLIIIFKFYYGGHLKVYHAGWLKI